MVGRPSHHGHTRRQRRVCSVTQRCSLPRSRAKASRRLGIAALQQPDDADSLPVDEAARLLAVRRAYLQPYSPQRHWPSYTPCHLTARLAAPTQYPNSPCNTVYSTDSE